MAHFPMTQNELLQYCEVFEQRVNLSRYPMGNFEVRLQRFGDDTSPFYLVSVVGGNGWGAVVQSFRINIVTGAWELVYG